MKKIPLIDIDQSNYESKNNKLLKKQLRLINNRIAEIVESNILNKTEFQNETLIMVTELLNSRRSIIELLDKESYDSQMRIRNTLKSN